MKYHNRECVNPNACKEIRRTMSATGTAMPLAIRRGLEAKYEALHPEKKEERK